MGVRRKPFGARESQLCPGLGMAGVRKGVRKVGWGIIVLLSWILNIYYFIDAL